eukprot:TRINITY_DN5792_c0_g1_i1.p1 TRINITY_DN5792_c0_g1~~TRINITY_DN5792_c0_g1_i1.p1  ORF type:complete len:395 (+),score=92.73 TRINITY_DN5792_c0_g1_i1:173-1357(+)
MALEADLIQRAETETALRLRVRELEAEAGMSMTRYEKERYTRQMLLPEVGMEGQLKLLGARVLIVGAGGLGCPAAMYLAGAGVGTIGIVDDDRVEMSNLHRQVLHTEANAGVHKAASARAGIARLNSRVNCVTHVCRLSSANAMELVEQYDLVLDASDNPATRYLVNDACVLAGKPLVSGSALKLEGQVTVFGVGDSTPCYRCLYPRPPQMCGGCGEAGVLGPITGVIGSLQALQAVHILVGNLDSVLSCRLLHFDGASTKFTTVSLPKKRRKNCAGCGSQQPASLQAVDYPRFCAVSAEYPELEPHLNVTCKQLEARMARGADFMVILDVRPANQFALCSLTPSVNVRIDQVDQIDLSQFDGKEAVSYTHLRAHETPEHLVCRLLLEKKKKKK